MHRLAQLSTTLKECSLKELKVLSDATAALPTLDNSGSNYAEVEYRPASNSPPLSFSSLPARVALVPAQESSCISCMCSICKKQHLFSNLKYLCFTHGNTEKQ